MTVLIKNKKVGLKYEILETLTAGVVLHGYEVKSLRAKQGSLDGAYVSMSNKNENPELWIKNFYIPPYQVKNSPDSYNPERERKLLLNRREIAALASSLNTAGTTLVPLSVNALGPHIKISIALVRGKKKFDKRQDMKKKTARRDAEREVKARLR